MRLGRQQAGAAPRNRSAPVDRVAHVHRAVCGLWGAHHPWMTRACRIRPLAYKWRCTKKDRMNCPRERPHRSAFFLTVVTRINADPVPGIFRGSWESFDWRNTTSGRRRIFHMLSVIQRRTVERPRGASLGTKSVLFDNLRLSFAERAPRVPPIPS